MEGETFTDILKQMKRNKRHRTRNDSSTDLKATNSDTNFVMTREKEQRQISQNIIRVKSKENCKNTLYKHKHCLKCKNCQSFRNILKKDKSALSSYIENNLNYLKLFGNQRYNGNPPLLFVQDYKRKISEKKMGLVPIPVKKNKTKPMNNLVQLYDLQRSIVMVRRYQYGRKNFGPAPTSNRAYDVTLIQRWWKNVAKIIIIQKCYRGYFIRKQVEVILNLHRFMDNFENLLILIIKKYAFNKIYRRIIITKRRKPVKGNCITKKILFLNNDITKAILEIQNNCRILIAKNKYNRLLREQKYTIVNRIEYISKTKYNMINVYEKIIMIQFNVRKYIKNKFYIDHKIINKDIGIYYIDKNYIDEYSKKIICFYKLMKHGLQLLAIKKIKSKYKNINEYNEDDINKVMFIQRKYLEYFYMKNIRKTRYNKKNKKSYLIDKLRIKDNTDKIELIQKMYRLYNINKNKFINKLIKNKPIFTPTKSVKIPNKTSQIIRSDFKKGNNDNQDNYFNKIIINKRNNRKDYKYKEGIIHNNSIKNNERLINNICYISKENKLNVLNTIKLLQTKIYSYLFIKNLRLKKNTKCIMKKGFNLSYIITKKYTDETHCIEQIKKIQHFYKKQYEYMKHNLIKFTISKSSSDSRRSSKLSDISFYDYNYDNEDNNILRINNYNNKKELSKIPNIGNNNA